MYEEYYDDLNKNIIDYVPNFVDEWTLSFNVTFADPDAISNNINELDFLEIKFKMREQIVDASNFRLLGESKLLNIVKVDP